MRQKSAKKATEKRQKSDTLATKLRAKLSKNGKHSTKRITFARTNEMLKNIRVCGKRLEVEGEMFRFGQD